MNTGLLHLHSTLRYLILIALIVVIVKSLVGWLGKKQYTNIDNRIGLYLFIFTHMQLVIGLVLYFVSDVVQFNGATMKNKDLRYWAVEHLTIMLISIVLITMARITSKKMSSDEAKHKRMVIFNGVALLLILVAISMSGRGII
jgi:low temperature requirement protein LtrA